ncbi:MAG: SGNH/GDSL hydrolase family protein [Lachnospiraceae bacterium]|nr:SGNH/GDSL hydrolase family protein [Lachnospiraceae bacterium]
MDRLNNDPVKFIKIFFLSVIAVCAVIVGIIVLFDPFYIYHKPLPHLKAVLNDKEYQCVGTLKNFDYDAVIVGSSVCENFNNGWFDEGFGCTSIKAIRSYGATADLKYLMDIAFEKHDIKYVFYNIDPSSLYSPIETTYESTGCPTYLYDDNPLNDWKYLLNKDVLMEKIPFMIAKSFSGYDEKDSYNWAQWKTFHHLMCMTMYERLPEAAPMEDEHMYDELAVENTKLLTEMVTAHPETEFLFFFSPYSMCWWDNAYRNGERDAVLSAERICIEELIKYDNVSVCYYQDDKDIITNLDNYMDTIHFSKDINKYICDSLMEGKDKITEENIDSILTGMYELSEKIESEYILEYYPE